MVPVPTAAPEVDEPHVPDDLFLDFVEGRRQFDAAVRRRMDISGEEFIRRYEAGEYHGLADEAGSLHVGDLIMLIPFAR